MAETSNPVPHQVVVAIFDDPPSAEQAVDDLKRHGFASDRISVVMRHDPTDVTAEEMVELDREADEQGTGIAVGSTVGGLAGLLGGLAMFTIPGVGPLLGIGVLATTVGGAALGAAAGKRFAADHDWELPEEHAERFKAAVQAGSIVLAVDTISAEDVMRAREVLAVHHAEEIEVKPKRS